MSGYALVGRFGDYKRRWPADKAKAMYAVGVSLAIAQHDILQVWRTTPAGDLTRYDGAATRKLTDKIVAAKGAAQR